MKTLIIISIIGLLFCSCNYKIKQNKTYDLNKLPCGKIINKSADLNTSHSDYFLVIKSKTSITLEYVPDYVYKYFQIGDYIKCDSLNIK